MMSPDLLAHAARGWARVGVPANKSADDITAAANAALDSAGIDHSNARVAVTVNGKGVDANTAVTGDQVKVRGPRPRPGARAGRTCAPAGVVRAGMGRSLAVGSNNPSPK
jgi:hypothetical protein